jgi:hypothetical protein
VLICLARIKRLKPIAAWALLRIHARIVCFCLGSIEGPKSLEQETDAGL